MATKIMTAYGNAQLDTAQKKFGTASGFFNGTSAYVDTPDSADFDVGSGDFTIDAWVRLNAAGINQYIYMHGTGSAASTTIQFYIGSDNKLKCRAFQNSTQYYLTGGSSTITADGNWHHVALVRYGNTLTIYQDGVSLASVSVAGATLNNSTDRPTVGRFGVSDMFYLNGWIDEFRFSKGIARWTSNFTPPTEPHTADAYTVLLLHMDGTDGSTSFVDDSESSAPSPLANTKANIGGAWKQAVDGHVKIDGIWKPISSIHTKIDGVWKQA